MKWYSKDGQIAAREVNGKKQAYKYDLKGQLLEVVGAEKYSYDPAGNLLAKTIGDKTTTYEYDKANQLISSTFDGKVTKYTYDAAGRLVKEGDKVYTYAWQDKITQVTEGGKLTGSYTYGLDGQLATATQDGKSESFLWDGLALIARNETKFVNEPYVTGGNPILADNTLLFNDMLGSTLGRAENGAYAPVSMTAFGETTDRAAFFTGKPAVGDLGYAFLFRNYRSDLAKWQTQDPLGYPDGWNNFAYVNNGVIGNIDSLGTDVINVTVSDLPHSAISTPEQIDVSYSIALPSFTYDVQIDPQEYSYNLYTLEVYGSIESYWDLDRIAGINFSVIWSYQNGSWVLEGNRVPGGITISPPNSPGVQEISITISCTVTLVVQRVMDDGRLGLFSSGSGSYSKTYTE